jgi:hypothetical protein
MGPTKNSLETLVKKSYNFVAFLKPTFSNCNPKNYHNAKHTPTPPFHPNMVLINFDNPSIPLPN